MNNKKRIKADMMLLLATFFWGMTFVTVKDAMKHSGIFSFIALRFFLAGLLIFPFIKRKMNLINKSIVFDSVLLGILVFASFAFQTAGLKYTSATRSSFITSLSVVLVPLVSFLLYKTIVDVYKIAGIVFASIGLLLLFPPEAGVINLGDALTLASACIFALVIVLIQKFSSRNDPILLVFIQTVVVAFLALIFAPFTDRFKIDFSGNFLFDLIFTAVFATAGSLVIQFRYQKDTSEARAGIIYTLEPLFASFFAFLILKESFPAIGFAGGAFIILGMVLSEFGK